MRSTKPQSLLLFLLIATLSTAQVAEGLHGNVFRSNSMALTYTFPKELYPRIDKLPQSAAEHVFFALWATPERSGVPRMAFLYTLKQRPVGISRRDMAYDYLEGVQKLWMNTPGVKMSGPMKISPAGYDIWRFDMRAPSVPGYHAAIVIPLADRRVLSIAITAPSQSEVDAAVTSLAQLRFDSMPR